MSFTVRAPGSSANLGPGFDALGLALDLWNEVEIDVDGEPGAVSLEGRDIALLAGEENLALTAMRTLASERGKTLPPFAMTLRTAVPVARGLGSSAAALAAGLLAANNLLDLELSTDELFATAWRMEGHGDNVGAALFGGAVLSVPGVTTPIRLAEGSALPVQAVVFIPEATGATWAARAALPATIPHPDAAFNVATAAGLAIGLLRGDPHLIAAGMHDRLHEPYRARLFPHLTAMTAAGREAGAYGTCLSGAGPSILALTAPETAPAIATAFRQSARHLGLAGEVVILSPAASGAHIVRQETAEPVESGDEIVDLAPGSASRH